MTQIYRLAMMTLIGAGMLLVFDPPSASANWNYVQRGAARRAWNGPYFNTEYGWPVVQVVPPNSHFHTTWSWGAAMTEMNPIYHQYDRAYPGEYYYSGPPFLPTPRWPGHTDQFGTYYIRGPW